MKLAEALLERKSLLEELNSYAYSVRPSLSHEEGRTQTEFFAVHKNRLTRPFLGSEL